MKLYDAIKIIKKYGGTLVREDGTEYKLTDDGELLKTRAEDNDYCFYANATDLLADTWSIRPEHLNELCPSETVPPTEPKAAPEAVEHDNVNHPSHYMREGALECFEELKLAFGKDMARIFCVLNAWKYRYRAAAKGGTEDIAKSDWYMARAKELNEELNTCYE